MMTSRRVSPVRFFFFNDTATTEIYTLSLHDALPISLPAAHPGFGGLLGHGLVREDPDPQLPAPLDEPCDRAARRLDLCALDPSGLKRLEAVLPERDRRAGQRPSFHPAAVGLPELGVLRHQHRCLSW